MRRLTLFAAAATPAQRRGRFVFDESIEPDGTRGVSRLNPRPGDACGHGPERRCAETARAIGLESKPLLPVRAWNLGSWAGRAIADVGAQQPAEFGAWRQDPGIAPHGGETLNDLLRRVAQWMEEPNADGRVVAVTDASVVRAAIVHALQSEWRAFWYLDVVPLSMTVLTHGRAEWRLRCAGAPMRLLRTLDDDGET
jgi:broad specificity phosphatase PhoE